MNRCIVVLKPQCPRNHLSLSTLQDRLRKPRKDYAIEEGREFREELEKSTACLGSPNNPVAVSKVIITTVKNQVFGPFSYLHLDVTRILCRSRKAL
ncbi:hypothetical protein AVEN_50602-1 [Araneus ventricosus]|uniref:Uncharacterized protein n=1 Tax=Araneus ventricosus TaxID=182803 RepID=A0A4Y2AQ41_ARAVE|nr:hypothetical protein AVEN_50602-1 [Araneus ventricosus]